jgi:nucleoside-diphosphate-sugar epimerase
MILVTGSSGYVASELIPLLKKKHEVFGLDRKASLNTERVLDIGQDAFAGDLSRFGGDDLIVIHLAAARFDFGATAIDYYQANVLDQANFLKELELLDPKTFIHMSSVASIDGTHIPYSENLSCDDAYRSTKYLQERIIEAWCHERNIQLIVLYPSAIFSYQDRSDTNIGKLVKLARYLPFAPKIPVRKSLTFLPHLCNFLAKVIDKEVCAGKYLTIETPVITVSDMIQLLCTKDLKLISIPCLQTVLLYFSYVLYALGGFGKLDTKLTPNRVKKLFSDTSYSTPPNIDLTAYVSHDSEDLTEILLRIGKGFR